LEILKMLTTKQTNHLTGLNNALETAHTELGDLCLDLEATLHAIWEADDDCGYDEDAQADISLAAEALGFLEYGLEDVAIKLSGIRCKFHLDEAESEAVSV
jgi:hypothetical protein